MHENQACNICIPPLTLKGVLAWFRVAVIFLQDVSALAPQIYKNVAFLLHHLQQYSNAELGERSVDRQSLHCCGAA